MREIRQSGLEGGAAQTNAPFLPPIGDCRRFEHLGASREGLFPPKRPPIKKDVVTATDIPAPGKKNAPGTDRSTRTAASQNSILLSARVALEGLAAQPQIC